MATAVGSRTVGTLSVGQHVQRDTRARNGGGIDNNGTITVSDSSFTQDQSANAGGGASGAGSGSITRQHVLGRHGAETAADFQQQPDR